MAGFVECLDNETAEEIINPDEGMKVAYLIVLFSKMKMLEFICSVLLLISEDRIMMKDCIWKSVPFNILVLIIFNKIIVSLPKGCQKISFKK